ncbi:D-aspartate oxidase [Periplaneta americana]|uniref:D-aspartate oxidase n=1 Tax=Periplaneta americana TaxID=6978 RepID=UPI0037E98B39
MGVLRVGVLGAGVVGVTTATELQTEFPTANITIIADKFNQDTTSEVAAGIFRPSTSFSGTSPEITSQWIRDSYEYYDVLRCSEQSSRAGVSQISGYMFSRIDPSIVQNSLLDGIVPLYRRATEEELGLCPGNWKYGSYFTTLLTECTKFLPWSLERFERAGGKVVKKTVTDFRELEHHFDIVVNCAGIGAKFLCSDNKLVPIRGQVIKMRAPWIKTFFYAEQDTYVIPRSDGVIMGGCRHYDSYDVSLSPYDSAAIRERCFKLIPSLQKASFIKERAGLRPHRSIVRVEPEVLNTGLGKLKIVHNYGHGGYGVTSAPGTAKHAVKLVRELHSSTFSHSKL